MENLAPYRILFVCMGNICRSPAAETVMNHVIQEGHYGGRIECDSAGTIDYHIGNPPDARMRQAAVERGYDLVGKARQVEYQDFKDFDLIVAMDRSNLGDLHAMDRHARYRSKTVLFCSFCTLPEAPEDVPDPYYGGRAGFDRVLDLLEDGCRGLLDHVRLRVEAA